MKARTSPATPNTRLYSKPPLVMKKPCLTCTLTAATSITDSTIAAASGVSRPRASSRPPPTSTRPAHQRMAPAGVKAERGKALPDRVKAGAAKPAEELLRAVRGEHQTNRRTQQKKSQVHSSPLYPFTIHN